MTLFVYCAQNFYDSKDHLGELIQQKKSLIFSYLMIDKKYEGIEGLNILIATNSSKFSDL